MSARVNVKGFTLLEALLFILISSIMISGMFLSTSTAFLKTPSIRYQWVALEAARTCMEWWIGQRRMNGFLSLTLGTSSPAACTGPTGYTVTSTITATTFNGDANYRTVNVAVTGLGYATVNWQAANY